MTRHVHVPPRTILQQTAFAEHGGDAGVVAHANILHDFSTCVNAHGPAAVIREAIHACDVAAYPDPRSDSARNAASVAWNRPLEEIMCGAGAAELIHAVCFAYVSTGDRVLILTPAFGEYHRAARLCGAEVLERRMPLNAERPFRDAYLDDVAESILTLAPRLVFATSPSSPTGMQLGRDEVVRIAEACARAGALLVLDQSYDAFAEPQLGTPALPGNPHVFHLRSITKEHALAGVRVAFAIAQCDVIANVERARVPWATSAPAQAAASASFLPEAVSHAARTVQQLRHEAVRLSRCLRDAGATVERSCTHYLLVRVHDAHEARGMLAAHHHILVRDCTSFGLPEQIRIAARSAVANQTLLNALHQCPQLIREKLHV